MIEMKFEDQDGALLHSPWKFGDGGHKIKAFWAEDGSPLSIETPPQLRDQLVSLQNRLVSAYEARTKGPWRNVNVSQPVANELVLVFYAWLEGSGKDIGWFDGKDWFTHGRKLLKDPRNMLGTCRALYWTPLPADPKYSFTLPMGVQVPETVDGVPAPEPK